MRKFLDNIQAVDGVLIISPINRRYFTKFNSSAGMLLITKNKNYFMTDFRYLVDAHANLKDCEIIETTADKKYYEVIHTLVQEHGIQKLGVEFDRLKVSEFQAMQKELPVEFIDISNDILLARNVKTEDELEKMRKAQEIVDKTFIEIQKFIKPGVTEKQIAAKLIAYMYDFGAEGLSFAPIVASGCNGASPHAKPTDKTVQNGEFITMDFGCIYDGYCSDMTRTVALGTPTEKMKEIYNLVLEAQLLGVEKAKANVKGSEIHNIVADLFKKHHVFENFGHGFGHGIGLEVHEGHGAGAKSEDILLENTVISAEPGLYFKDFCGVRIEDLLVLKENGNENLTKSPKQLIIL